MRTKHNLKPKAYARIKDYQTCHYHTADFDKVVDYLKWKWTPDSCYICAESRPRLDNYKNISEDINHRWLDNGSRIKCCRMFEREQVSRDIAKELERGWKVDSLKLGDNGMRRRVRFQTRTQWDYPICKETIDAWKDRKHKVQRFHERSYGKVETKNFKVSSDVPVGRTEHVGGLDRWNMHRLMADNNLDDDDTLLGRPTTYFGIPSRALLH